MSTINSILFVCLGNICRSPAGENVMRKLLDDAGLHSVRCDSAGTIDYHAGAEPDPRMRAAGRRRGLPMTGCARKVTRDDFSRFDLILAMDQDNYAQLMMQATPEQRHKIKLFCSYCTAHAEREVPDPYYGGADGFEKVLDLLEDGCAQIVRSLQVARE